MRLSLELNKKSGFTLVEMLIIVPIALLAVGAMVMFITSLVGDAVTSREYAVSTYSVSDASNRIEQDIRLSVQFISSLSGMPVQQSKNGAGAAFVANATDTVVLQQYATTSSPYNSNRVFLYFKNTPNVLSACNSTSLPGNSALMVSLVYFLKNGSLWRRTIVPAWNITNAADATYTCKGDGTAASAPWQRDSCPADSTINATCQTFDEQILPNVSSMAVSYYTADGTTQITPVANVETATYMKIVLATSKTVAGETITNTNTIKAKRINKLNT